MKIPAVENRFEGRVPSSLQVAWTLVAASLCYSAF